jgi:excisionase family DNA binding protein
MEQVYYTIAEAAEKLRCTPAAIRKWIAQGKMDVVYVGSDRRITSEALDAFVKSSTEARKARHSTNDVQSEDIRTPMSALALNPVR